jgi:hypothetical protein
MRTGGRASAQKKPGEQSPLHCHGQLIAALLGPRVEDPSGRRLIGNWLEKIRSQMHRFSFRIGAVLVAAVQVAWIASLLYWGLWLLS